MKQVTAAAIYARISSDPSGTGLGVERQLEDCRKLAASRGWRIAEEYVDNDISAYSRRARRPRYDAMLADIEDGRRDAVIVYNIDRLTRQPSQLEDFVALCDSAGVTTVATVTGDLDLGNDQGLFVARIMGAVAAQESGRKSARLRRAAEQHAEMGKPRPGAHRAYGWEKDGMTLVPVEAAVIRDMIERHLAGESFISLAYWLNENGYRTTTGGEWRAATLRNVLINPRLAGLRAHNGVVVGKGIWPPIISEDQHQRMLTLVKSRAKTGKRSPRVSLLAGIARCALCDGRLHTARREGTRIYLCQKLPGYPNCGRLGINGDAIDAIVTEAALTRLDSAELAAALRGEASRDAATTEIADGLARDEAQMEELASMYADRLISAAEWRAARDVIQARIVEATRTLHAASGHPEVDSLAGTGKELRESWADMPLTRQTAIISAVLDSVTVLPAKHKGSRDYLSRIVPNWSI